MILCRDCLRWGEAHETLDHSDDDYRHVWWWWACMQLGGEADCIGVLDPGLEWALNRGDYLGDLR